MTIMKVITKPPPTVEDKPTVQEPAEKKTPMVQKKTPKVQKKAKIDFSKEDKTIMEERSKQFEEKFKFKVQYPMNPNKLTKIRRGHKKSTEVMEEPTTEWTKFDDILKNGKKPSIKFAFDVGENYYNIHLSSEEAPPPTELHTAVDKDERIVEMAVNPLDQPKFKLLSGLMSQPPWSVRLILYFNLEVSEVGTLILAAKEDLQKLIEKLPEGKAREYFRSELAAVKFVGSIVDDVEGVQEGRLKFAFPWAFRNGRELAALTKRQYLWALYFDPADKNEIRAIEEMTVGMERQLKLMSPKHKNYALLKKQVTNLNKLLYHCMAAEILESSQRTAFGHGKKKPRSTMAEDDDEKYGL
ncbi:hypothetical protein M3Y95_01168900 [Aphelenchoides besseyi]|nr:hypothetical protein M3Y95_01168900 [Aphelenchoides besseyi]